MFYVSHKLAEVLEWDVDIFIIDDELPFAGHPTIGTAAYILGLSKKGDGRFIIKTRPVLIFMSWDRDRREGTLPIVSADIPHNVHIHVHTIGDLERLILSLSSILKIRKAELKALIMSIVKGITFLLIKLMNLALLREVKMESPRVDFYRLLDRE
jgi:predicted PhzF superfamily epimerase YddE/YHI9